MCHLEERHTNQHASACFAFQTPTSVGGTADNGRDCVIHVEQIDHIALTVRDLEHSATWYRQLLGLERRYAEVWDVPLMLCAGQTCLALFPATGGDMDPAPDYTRSVTLRHFAFRVSRAAFVQAQAVLSEQGIEWSFEDHAICHSIYFFDPDGYRLELTTYDIDAAGELPTAPPAMSGP